MRLSRILCTVAGAVVGISGAATAQAADTAGFPPHAKILDGFEKIVTKAKIKPMYTLYGRKTDGQMYAELPSAFSGKKYFIAVTLASGDRYAGLQGNDFYVYWKRYDKRMALIQPNISVRAPGDKDAESSVKRLFTDRVLLDIPIVTMGPGGGPLIDLDTLLVGQARKFFGGYGQVSPSAARNGLFTVTTAKAFENNIEVAFEVPTGDSLISRFNAGSSAGILKKLHYSISEIPKTSGYKPRVADQRIGFFTTSYTDLAKYNDRETRIRYINRWNLQKADTKLNLSPPKQPIVFYIEHTTPVRYRRWVREGVLAWNRAFEKVGIADAIEVYYQDRTSKAHMDKDPEDVNYNFIRWLNNNIGTAIGPSRVNPLTGQILDADIILTDGWIRHYQKQFSELLPGVAMEGYGPETLAWLARNPGWDPRIRLAPPAQREEIAARIQHQSLLPYSGHPAGSVDSRLIGDDEYDGLIGRTSQINGMCMAAEGMSFDLALMRMSIALLADEARSQEEKNDTDGEDEDSDDAKKEDKDKEQMLDGMPESFVGPLIAHLVAHEVGHTLGLRHNFKASSVYSLAEINSADMKGKKQLAGSVMDYIGVNINQESGEIQGDYSMSGIGPYDEWAIEYGYTFGDIEKVLERVAEPELVFGTDEDLYGPDPLARRYDFSREPLDFAHNQMRLVKYHRERLLSDFIKDGDSWDRIRYGYELTLSLQTRAISMMANWVGGAFVNRDKKGDPSGRMPVEVVPAEQQRKALRFVVDNAFNDDVFGLTPELVTAMGRDKWLDDIRNFFQESTWPIHDRVIGIQSSALTMLMNPTTLKWVYDNELRIPEGEDALTLPELLTTISAAVWGELSQEAQGEYSARKPLISSLRRNLQREHLQRLIDLTLPGNGNSAASRAISMLSAAQLQNVLKNINAAQSASADQHDDYTAAHLTQTRKRIEKALDADYILNPSRGGGLRGHFGMFGREQDKENRRRRNEEN
ncbi:MAG: zinc-dependent metalloprotease [Fuerstiella sp.]|nr:zinc-dependent metalloprotease [Fuerstiella sp.]